MWRSELLRRAQQGFMHPAWGWSHCARVYGMARDLAEDEGLDVDDDVLFAVAYLHDAGPFLASADGESLPELAARDAERYLPSIGFSAEKVPEVVQLIRCHDFEHPPGAEPEAAVFHDADMLDFLGAVGVTRLLAIVGLEDWTPDVRTAVEIAEEFAEQLPGRVVLDAAHSRAEVLAEESLDFVESLRASTRGFEEL